MEHDLLLRNAAIIDENGDILRNRSICIKAGVISKITEGNESCTAKEIIDCTGLYISPGFVNLHTHSPMNIFKGIAEDVSIADWFNREIWPYESKLTGDNVYCGALSAIGEMLDNGVTAFADHYFYADRICDAVLETGIKADVAPTVFGMDEGFKTALEDVSKLIIQKNGISTRLKLRMGPHCPHTSPGDTLKAAIDRAKDLGVGIHIHVAETWGQVQESLEKYGCTPFERLNNAGGFDLPCIVAHGLWIQEDDRKYLSPETYIAACPKTYMKLSMGSGHLWEESGKLPLCTGTDGAASSNTLDPLEQTRFFGLVGKFINNDSTGFDLIYLWKMLMRGHKALQFRSGRMSEGYSADLIVWDLTSCGTAEVYNPLAAIIYSASSKNIINTIIDGKLLKKNGKVQIGNAEALNKLSDLSRNIKDRGKGKTNLNF
ncbi:MAG: cytosine deaminase [Clostridia bacterium BRH_c25]|nr:MAG: cytosine deaminase [Clostridia bacterium BRH_c25]